MNNDLSAASCAIEALLVQANPRGMATLRQALRPGYLLRAAQQLLKAKGNIAIVTGFPVADTIETDGPAGAQVLYRALAALGQHPVIWGEPEMLAQFFPDFAHQPLTDPLGQLLPFPEDLGAVVVIERPGAASDGRFYNIRGQDISERCLCLAPVLADLDCPLIAIGDGGNEVGMGAAGEALKQLPIRPAVSGCDELLIGDVSNWAAYALALMLAAAAQQPLLDFELSALLDALVRAGAVDGVTAAPTATEDNFPATVGDALIAEIRGILATQHSFSVQDRSQ